MKVYTTIREDGNTGPDVIANNFKEAEKVLSNLLKSSKKRYRIVGERIQKFKL